MGLWGRRKERLEDMHRQALLRADCERSVGVILDMIQLLEVLEDAGEHRRSNRKILHIAAKCCENPIISYDSDSLRDEGLVGLSTVQNDILNKIAYLAEEDEDAVQAFYNIAVDKECPDLIAYCRQKIEQLRSAL